MMASSRTHRHYCFILDNPTKDEYSEDFTEEVRYCVWQRERGELGTERHQGYIEFKSPQPLETVQAIIGEGVRVRPRRGSRNQARSFYMREEARVAGPWEYGSWNEGGRRKKSDLERLAKLLLEGKSEREIGMEDFELLARHRKAIRRWKQLHGRRRSEETQICASIEGPATRDLSLCDESSFEAFRENSEPWFDGHYGQESIEIDEIEKNGIPLKVFLELVDRFELGTPVKEGIEE